MHPRPWSLAGLVYAFTLVASSGGAQCNLANPSFEVGAAGSQTFGGWNEFGRTGLADRAVHGHVAAALDGPDLGNWAVSGIWQPLDAHPGQVFEAAVFAWHCTEAPLTGGSQGILNVEWRDGSGLLIDYVSYPVVTASSDFDAIQSIRVQTPAAPVGTAEVRVLLGALQAPGEPAPRVNFDLVEFREWTEDPAEGQWGDFPGGRTLDFAGFEWRVKGSGHYQPGSSWYSDESDAVWVDASGRLHLTLRDVFGQSYATEVTLTEALGYGDYVFTTVGRLDQLEVDTVLGLFLWEYGPCYDPSRGWWNPYNEIDVEVSRWSEPDNPLLQFVAQPYDWTGNRERFDASFEENERVSHAFRWLNDRVEFRSWRGGPDDEPADAFSPQMLHRWVYEGPHVPRPEQPRVHMNLWPLAGAPNTDQEVVVESFRFVPDCIEPHCDPFVVANPAAASRLQLGAATPNPFNPRTRIEFELERSGYASLVVYDVSGRRVRELFGAPVTAGRYRTDWDGRDDRGRDVASGVYLYRLKIGGEASTRRMVLVR